MTHWRTPKPLELRVTVTLGPNHYKKISEKDQRGKKPNPNAGRKLPCNCGECARCYWSDYWRAGRIRRSEVKYGRRSDKPSSL